MAAAARASQLVGARRPERVVLVGIAGTYAPERLPVGTASSFDDVVLDGVGAGEGAALVGPADLGFPLWPGSVDTTPDAVYERLPLTPAGPGPATTSHSRVLVTVCAASAGDGEARRRRERHAGALAEDMEAFGVALACVLHGIGLTVIRGISNLAGDRDHTRWRTGPALDAVGPMLEDILRAAPAASPGPPS